MMQTEISFSRRDIAKLNRLAKRTPRTLRYAHGVASGRALRRFRKVMRNEGGVYDVPSFAPLNRITTSIHGAHRIGGILNSPRYMVRYRRGDKQIIGWVSGLAEWASRFQEPNRYQFTREQRRTIHIRARMRFVPREYDRPARDVVTGFTVNMLREYPSMLLEAYDKRVSLLLRRGRAVL